MIGVEWRLTDVVRRSQYITNELGARASSAKDEDWGGGAILGQIYRIVHGMNKRKTATGALTGGGLVRWGARGQ